MDRSIKPRTTEANWSLLPNDPVMEIGGRILITGDVDYYVGMPAIIHSWRSAMDDPKDSPTDARFLLRQWVMLDEEHDQTSTLGYLFLNTVTGRFARVKRSPASPTTTSSSASVAS